MLAATQGSQETLMEGLLSLYQLRKTLGKTFYWRWVEKEEREKNEKLKSTEDEKGSYRARKEQETEKNEELEGSMIWKPQQSKSKSLLEDAQKTLNRVCCQSESVDWQKD